MTTLRMVRVPLDAVKLMALAQRRGLHLREVDLGYVIHCALDELFGPALSPKPFSFPAPTKGEARARVIPVLGYGTGSAAEMRAHAQTFAEPGVHALCLWDELADKEMPASFEAGRRVGFTARVCPIVRTHAPGDHPRATDRKGRARSREVDAFLHATFGLPKEQLVSREEVYVKWLREEFEARGGAVMDAAKMTRFERERITRRRAPDAEGQRASTRSERPDAVMEGTLTVTDSVAFNALLARGLGRHRAFGFGMLLLRPPTSR